MIEISRGDSPKEEFKILYRKLRFIKHHLVFTSVNRMEMEYTHCIDSLICKWKRLTILKDTMNKLHRFAIAYRHNALHGTK